MNGTLKRTCTSDLPSIRSHQLTLRDNVTAHGFVEFRSLSARAKIECLIERKNFEVITMRT